jgi:hypothetical protein
LKELSQDWAPEGHTEIHLIEQIGLAEWRLRRVHRAELGEIRKQMASRESGLEESVEHAQRKAVEEALVELEDDGSVSPRTCTSLELVFGKKPDSPATWLRIWFKRDQPDEKVAERIWKAARRHLQSTLKKVREQEETDLEIARQRLSIPEGPQLERIQRYETAIKRDMYRAIEKLERLQRRRRGEPLPPTVNVNVSKDD